MSTPAEHPPSNWLTQAKLVGAYLRCRARSASDGSVVWLKPLSSSIDAQAPLALGPYLYAGSTGISLFLAALGHVLGDEDFCDCARRSLVPIRRRLSAFIAAPSAAPDLTLKLGGLVGLGALLYSFVRIGLWLDEQVLLEEACEVATLITPERIEKDVYLDLMYGSAGAVLSLLLLDREVKGRHEIKPLERAIACGEHLLRQRTSVAGEPLSWPFRGGLPHCGFAHGAAGISYALALLADRTGRDDFRQAAREGLRFERLLYVPEEQNWRSSSTPGKPSLIAWCNGAPGIALSRLRLAATSLSGSEVDEDLMQAVATTQQAEESAVDFACCGNIGRAEILLEAARSLGRTDLLAQAQEIAARVAGRASLQQSDPSDQLGFFRGTAGLGYAFLRLAEPSLPCILALE